MSFPRYPEYKDSGVEWLGEVPAHWWSIPIKYMALQRNSLFLDGDWIESKDISSEGIRYITTGNVGEGEYKEQGAGFISEVTFHALKCTEVYEGDVLISRLNNPIGRACIVPDLGARIVTSVDNVIFRPDDRFQKKFLVYLCSSDEYFKHTGNLARGATMQRISRGLLGNIRVVVPSLEEQKTIAAFLDHETARIDALIAEQQRLIELLKEKRQAFISHAVTKGLDPAAPMRDSGVEWLGEIPAHWGVWRSKRLFPESKLRSSAEDEQLTASQDWGVITQKEFVRRAGRRVVQINQHFDKRKRVERDDFVISMRSFQGGLERAWTSGGIRSSYVVLKPVGIVNVGYFERLFKSGRYIQALHSTANFIRDGQDLNYQNFCEVDLPLPPEAEQRQIAEHLRYTTETIDALVGNSQASVELLEERRSALISAAVTGKIDVRNWRPPADEGAFDPDVRGVDLEAVS